MALKITYHSMKTGDSSPVSAGFPIRPAQVGDRETLAVSGTAANSTPVTDNFIARVLAGEACGVKVGVGAIASAANSMPIPAGGVEELYVPFGARISVIAD